ncbi:MAG: SDR family NAD(P)-dependent oxidoreductase [bacterium]|nr:SDR family NAD(P)-dependent oxidoreductase [bacterium]
MGDLSGRICLITGATNGLGLATAKKLALMGATLVIVGRNEEKTRHIVNALKVETNHQQIEYLLADLSLMRDVRLLAGEFKARYKHLHILINNAGAIFPTRQLTSEGLEASFALNYLSGFLLTTQLLDHLKTSGTIEHNARIVNVSSYAHTFNHIEWDNLQGEKDFDSFRAYGRAKLMQILFTYELHHRLRAEGAHVAVNALHPGSIKTDIWDGSVGFFRFVGNIITPTTLDEGAEAIFQLATSPQLEHVSGKYFTKQKMVKSNRVSYKQDDWKRLWQVSEALLAGLA